VAVSRGCGAGVDRGHGPSLFNSTYFGPTFGFHIATHLVVVVVVLVVATLFIKAYGSVVSDRIRMKLGTILQAPR